MFRDGEYGVCVCVCVCVCVLVVDRKYTFIFKQVWMTNEHFISQILQT